MIIKLLNKMTGMPVLFDKAELESNANTPSDDQKNALAGTSGTPADGNKYVTDKDSRMSNARTPTTHDNSKHSTDYAALTDVLFEDNNGVIRQKSGYDDDFVFGSPQLDDDDNSDHGRRVFFDKSKGYFFAGEQGGDGADEDNRGDNSVNFGLDGEASANFSSHFGSNGEASGNYSTHFGYGGTASGYYCATHFGYGGTASGNYSTHFGSNGEASGNYSTHFGYGGTASGNYSTHFGYNGTVSGDYCAAHFGESGIASGNHSTHFGTSGIADSRYQTVFSPGANGADGDAQTSIQPWHDETAHSDDSWQDIFIDGFSEKRSVQIDGCMTVRALVSGVTQDAAKTFSYEVTASVKNVDGTTSINSQSVNVIHEDDNDFDVQVAVDNDDLKVQVKDSTSGGDDVRWAVGWMDTEAVWA